jgi:hypothetical protein
MKEAPKDGATVTKFSDGSLHVVCNQCGADLFMVESVRGAIFNIGRVSDHYHDVHGRPYQNTAIIPPQS